MCEKPQPTICGAGWSQFGDCCYTLLSTWQDIVVQRGYCQDSGAELVSISSLVENTFVQEMIPSVSSVFIGLRRDGAGLFTSWLDGKPFGGSFFSNWNPDEPNNAHDIERCAEMTERTGQWNDISCDLPRRAVCERCLSITTTSTTTTTTTTTTPTTTTASTTTTTPTTTTPSTTKPTTTVSTIKPTTSTSITVGNFDCRTVRTNVNCGAANGLAACDAQCRLFKYGRGICYSFGTTTCPGYPPGSKGCLCYDTLDCRSLRTQVNCAAANAALSCTNWCKAFQWTRGACTTFTSLWTCPGYAAGQKACLCQ
ncbi:C-type lectin domain family 17member A [Aphelenchoides avenae]|nr:C-type lectin domain family 17member A [Aphelenchus avenae]